MKKLIFLPLIFLVSCAATAPQEPFKAGDTFLMTGTAKDGQSVSQRFTLRGKGDWDDGEWDYDADGSGSRSGLFVVSADQHSVSFLDYAELLEGQIAGSEQILACIASTDGLGWKQGEGRLIKGTKASITKMMDEWKTKSASGAFNALVDGTGSCMISRS